MPVSFVRYVGYYPTKKHHFPPKYHQKTSLFYRKIWWFRFFFVTLHPQKKGKSMTTYAITINERANEGKALMSYL